MSNTSTFNPGLFILGVAKCGTTSLHAFLNGIEGVCMSNPKEPYFFECEFEQGLSFYKEKYFKHWNGESVIGEARHRNLYLPYTAERIHQVNPNAKLIVILRNPVERAYSHWWHFYSRKQEDKSFKDAIQADLERIQSGKNLSSQEERAAYCSNLNGFLNGIYRTYIDSGYYYDQIVRFYDYFPKDQLLILNFDDLSTDSKLFKQRVLDFIGVEGVAKEIEVKNAKNSATLDSNILAMLRRIGVNKIVPSDWKTKLNEIRLKRFHNKQRDEATFEFLKEHFKPHNQKLKEIIDFNIDNWDN